jgi:hypothetical protein
MNSVVVGVAHGDEDLSKIWANCIGKCIRHGGMKQYIHGDAREAIFSLRRPGGEIDHLIWLNSGLICV